MRVGRVIVEDVLGPLFDALPHNTHLHTLDCDGAKSMSYAFARDRMLPAVRANTSLRRLFDPEDLEDCEDPDVERILREAVALVERRGGMPAEQRG